MNKITLTSGSVRAVRHDFSLKILTIYEFSVRHSAWALEYLIIIARAVPAFIPQFQAHLMSHKQLPID